MLRLRAQARPRHAREGVRELTHDVTGYQRNYEELRLSEERFRLLVEGVREYAMFMLDPEGNVIGWNAGAERLTGYPEGDILGLHVSRFFPADEERTSPEQALSAAAAQGDFRHEGWQERKDGSRFWAEVTLTALRDRGGALRGFALMAHDITDRRSAEEEIRTLNVDLEARVQRRTAELAQANRELESFSYSVSHDLRAPLRAIDGFSKALLGAAFGLDEQSRHYLGRIRAGAKRMSELIDDLLALSRVTRSELRLGPVDLSEVARGVALDLRRREPERQVEIAIAEGLVASADRRLMAIALQNLLDNAWKFTARKQGPHIEVGAVDREEGRAFFVRDNGAGFDPAYAGNLFGAFQRLHDPAEFEGTGIGLATTQRIVARHGGQIWAESAPGRGATFFFTLVPP